MVFLRVIAVVFFVFFLNIYTAYSTQEDTPLTASVNVNSIFKISIQDSFLDFGSVDPGEISTKKDINLSCVTNNNKDWSVSIYAQSPLAYEEYEIPLSNFKWEASVLNGSGQVSTSGNIGLTPVNFYVAGIDDYITETPVELALSMHIDVPAGQVAGRYRTILVVTMHEE